MDPLQIWFNSFILVVLLVRFAERIYDHPSRNGIAALAWLAISGINTLFLSRYYEMLEAVARGAAIGLIYIICWFAYVIFKRRARSTHR